MVRWAAMRTLPVLLTALFAIACSSGTGPSKSGALEPTWSVETAEQARGLTVTLDGDVLFAVAYREGTAFAETGGIMIVGPDGEIRAEVPLEVPSLCEGCTRLAFNPSMPHVVGNIAWVMDRDWNLFRIDLDTFAPTHVPITGRFEVPGIAGLDGNSAISADGRRALLAGLELAVLELETGTVERTVDFGTLVRSVVHLGGDDFLLNLTEPFSEEGRIVVWNLERNETTATADLPYPVVALAASGDWIVGALEPGPVGEYALFEIDRALSDPQPLQGVSVPPGPIHLALHPEERLVAVGSGGIQVYEPVAQAFPGTTVIVDADEGPLVDLETSSVKALSFSPDGMSLFVADTGGLKGFTLPD